MIQEKDIEKKLREGVEARGGRCLKWVCPGHGGVPDRLVLLPGGKIYFVETKRPKGGVVSALQRKWREWLTALDFEVFTLWTKEDVDQFLRYTRKESE